MGYLRNAFKKATLTTVLATSLVAGAGQSAFAQQAGRPPQPSGNGQQTEQVSVQVRPWANDQNYVRQVVAYERQEDARIRVYKAQEQAQFAQLDASYQQQQAAMFQYLPAYRAQGLAGMMNYAAAENQINVQNKANHIQYKANWDAVFAREDAAHEEYVANLDLQFGNLPQYKDRYNPGNQKPTVAAPDETGGGISLTPAQQHARLVRAYQEAELQSATSGGKVPMPDPAKYGLDSRDPAIQHVRPNR